MNKSKKVWVIVYGIVDLEIKMLLLKPNPEFEMNYDYYVITGGVEENETTEQAAIRETSEEIGVMPVKIIKLEETVAYIDRVSGMKMVEECYAVEIENFDLTLNEEHIDYKWVSIERFTKLIWWEGSKNKLRDIIQKFKILT
jgi:8-oxo-dGTP pyrophosphatase MutT (NUDIX family)